MLLSVDGGVNLDTVGACAEAGADVFVTGSALFSKTDYGRFIDEMTGLARSVKGSVGFRQMLQIVLIRPGSTDYDVQQRIQGSLDIPLNEQGWPRWPRRWSNCAARGIEVIYAGLAAADANGRA